jgi:hypothetical protein
MAKEYAKEVYSFDTGEMLDRTKEPHPLGLFDVDFRDPKAPNEQARNWTYAGSKKTMDEAMSDAKKLLELRSTMEIRIVKSDTGEVLRKLSEVV